MKGTHAGRAGEKTQAAKSDGAEYGGGASGSFCPASGYPFPSQRTGIRRQLGANRCSWPICWRASWIGPQIGFGLISDEASIETLSEIGLILLLFIIGLELDLKKLLAAGRPVLIIGVLQFPLCVALGLLFFMPFGFRMGGGDFGLLYLAVCLAISSTMIVVKLLYDKFELDTLPDASRSAC